MSVTFIATLIRYGRSPEVDLVCVIGARWNRSLSDVLKVAEAGRMVSDSRPQGHQIIFMSDI
jgi:hypothetical protein